MEQGKCTCRSWFDDNNSDAVHASKRRKTETGVKRVTRIDADGNELIYHISVFLDEDADSPMTSPATDELAEITDASLSVEGEAASNAFSERDFAEGSWGEEGESD